MSSTLTLRHDFIEYLDEVFKNEGCGGGGGGEGGRRRYLINCS